MLTNYRSILNSNTFKDFFALLSGRIMSALFNFLILILLMNKLSLAGFGEFTYLFAVMGAIQLLLDLGIDNSFTSVSAHYYNQCNKENFLRVKYTYLNFKYMISACILILSAFSYIYLKDKLLIFIIVFSIPLGISDSIMTVLRVMGKFKVVAFLLSFINILRIVIVGVLYHINFLSIESLIYGYCISNLIYFFICSLYLDGGIVNKIFVWEELKEILQITKWLLFYNISIILMMRVEIFIMKYYSSINMIDENQLGIYGAAFRLAFFLPLITNSITAVLLPKISLIKTQSEIENYLIKIKSLIIPIAVIIVCTTLVSSPIIHFAFGAKYDDSIKIFQILILAVSLTIFTNIIMLLFYSTKQVNYLAILSIIQLGANIILDLILIRYYAALGAAVAMFIVRLLGLLLIIYLLKNKLKLPLNEQNDQTLVQIICK